MGRCEVEATAAAAAADLRDGVILLLLLLFRRVGEDIVEGGDAASLCPSANASWLLEALRMALRRCTLCDSRSRRDDMFYVIMASQSSIRA